MFAESHRLQDPVPFHGADPFPECMTDGDGFLRYRENLAPALTPEQHRHPDFELRLIVGTSGIAIVGDHVGSFAPGQLVLTGPNLLHRWVSLDARAGRPALRDLALRFPEMPLRRAASIFPELGEALPLLERASMGIEFFGLSERAREHLLRIKAFDGLRRFAEFSGLLGDLARCTDYHLLSRVPLTGCKDSSDSRSFSDLIDRVIADPRDPPAATVAAGELDMAPSRFSRHFHAATGRSYSDFVVRIRVAHARRLLADTSASIAAVSCNTGFRNVSTFNRRFLELEGLTPTDFRQQALAHRNVN